MCFHLQICTIIMIKTYSLEAGANMSTFKTHLAPKIIYQNIDIIYSNYITAKSAL